MARASVTPDFIRYTTVDSVKTRCAGKVQFQQEKVALPEEMSNDLLYQLIQDAEADIELALSERYFVPFQRTDGAAYSHLPDHTKRQLRKVVDLRAVELILGTDFARGGHTDGDEAAPRTKDFLLEAMDLLLGRASFTQPGVPAPKRPMRVAPPLPGLMLALGNQADTGKMGTIINTDESVLGAETYAAGQINNPSAAFVPHKPNRGGVF